VSETWKVAELLEEIAEKAEPSRVISRVLTNIRGVRNGMSLMVMSNPEQMYVEAVYMLPVERIMNGVDGTPEEVLQWLHTGMGEENASIAADPSGRLCFRLRQVVREPAVIHDVQDALTELTRKMSPPQDAAKTYVSGYFPDSDKKP